METTSQNQPFLTIWVAARNEEERLPFLLSSIQAQSYPADRFEVLIGNDESTDGTLGIARSKSAQVPNIKVIDVDPAFGPDLYAKGRVLAYLTEFTRQETEYVLIIDADIVLQPDYLANMVKVLKQTDYDMVSGITTIQSGGWFGQMQGLDWLVALQTVSWLTAKSQGITALGNNMAFRWSAYLKTGGYKHLGPSVVEDFQLFKAFMDSGFSTANIYDKALLSVTEGPRTFGSYLKQRRRWLSGGLQTYTWIQMAFFGQFAWYPLLLWGWLSLTGMPSMICISLVLVRYVVATSLVGSAWYRAGRPQAAWLILFYELYFFVGYLSTSISYAVAGPSEWKGRKPNH